MSSQRSESQLYRSESAELGENLRKENKGKDKKLMEKIK